MFIDSGFLAESVYFNITESRTIVFVNKKDTNCSFGIRINFKTTPIGEIWKKNEPKISHLNPNINIDYAMVGSTDSVYFHNIVKDILEHVQSVYGGIIL